MATDYDCWHESSAAVNVEQVIKIFSENVEKVTKIIIHSIEVIASKNWDDIIDKLNVRFFFFLYIVFY